ncbi:DUF3147 family protein [Bacillus atrophaeus]|uniref:DUF3147 family protein n=1 Tax=Bacillus atrophaeus TaxID=1452 RepID=UPI00227DFE06|nr:DUF3147 family protein [Bacillus atrophaeus]MCY8810274.1 DUF3147 family protein [Bacillus atrophaeus]MCY8921258.1 DUF3147 family protein [Bacillus atrophaeus]
MAAVSKILVSALLIGLISGISKKYPAIGGMIAALPLLSLLSLFWMRVQGEETETLSRFALGVLFGLPATICLLVTLALLLRASMPFFLSVCLSIVGWAVFLLVQQAVFKYFLN